jgi:hypothetical protein
MKTPGQDQPFAGRLSRRAQQILSAALLLHVLAVVIAPLAVTPSSPLIGSVWQVFRPYLEAAFLNHGYKFFAPDPGPTHLVRYELELPGGTRREGIFPNLKEQRPRLLYHRHMMLSERLSGSQPGFPQAPWVEVYARSYAQHLLKEHGAKQVTLYVRRHHIPSPMDVQQGRKLDDPALNQEWLLIRYPEVAP